MISTQKNLCLGVILCSGLLLAGCQKAAQTSSQADTQASTVQAPPQQISVSPPPPPAAAETKTNKIGLCQSELASLKQVNPKAYAVKQANFNRLVNNASVYSAVRGDVNSTTKDTLDALYKYKTNQLCAEIERDVLQGLIQRGESVK
jgi:outer membrane murein-binding lipoprotein Lpp